MQVVRRIKEYPDNRYTMSSVLNLCGLIAQNYKLRYIHKTMKFYPFQQIELDEPICVKYNAVNVFRVKLYNYAKYLREYYPINYIEALFQQMLLNIFYPTEYEYDLEFPPSFDFDKINAAHYDILNLENNVDAFMEIDHSPEGLKNLDRLDE